INMSLGQGQNDPMMAAAVQSASDAGVVIVVAAGNDGTNNNAAATPTYPCNSTAANLICVAALDQSYRLATFSNYGATSVDVGAPGTNVLSGYAGTETVERETFRTENATTTNWTTSGGGWAYGSRQILFGGAARAFDMLLNPSDWDGQTKQYAKNLDAKAYKNFNLAGYSSAQLGFAAFVDIDAGDAISISSKATGGDPFVGGTALDFFNGSTDGAAVFLGYDLSSCRSANCTIGFRLRTGAATTDFGMAIFGLSVTGLTLNKI